jgi:DNA-binding CsgD family transcriptional regulator
MTMGLPSRESTIAGIIGAIGQPDFAAIAAHLIGDLIGFDLAAVILHRRGGSPVALFDNFDSIGGRQGIENYVGVTHRINPILAGHPARGALRARDFRIRPGRLTDGCAAHLVHAPEEELGFRTVGWPERLEEVGLYFPACDGVVECGFYRQRGARPVPPRALRLLGALEAPIAAAFDCHTRVRAHPGATHAGPLSPREREVADLLLRGCSSEAIGLRLGISRHTVKDHRKAIFRKLGIGSLAELFAAERSLH